MIVEQSTICFNCSAFKTLFNEMEYFRYFMMADIVLSAIDEEIVLYYKQINLIEN